MKSIYLKSLAAVLAVLTVGGIYTLTSSAGNREELRAASPAESGNADPSAATEPTIEPESKEAISTPAQVSPSSSKSRIVDREAYERSIEASKPSTAAYFAATSLYFDHEYEAAFNKAEEAIELGKGGINALIVEDAQRLQGKIRLAQGRYTEALELLKVEYKVGRSGILDLEIALCYVKLGDLELARQFYSDNAILKTNIISEEDLPGTDTARNFEASIRFARGLDYFFTSRKQAALEELTLAESLAPTKGAISYFAGMSLIHADRYVEAKPYFERAVKNSSGRILEDAQRRYRRMP